MMDAKQLLTEYAQYGSETAFREVVERYINFVYGTALRLVKGDTHLAEDITQVVFTGLARKAASLTDDVMLGGWLHQSTFHVATKFMRAERRRQARESEAMQMSALEIETDWRHAVPLLDEAITQLDAKDRAAIVMRFFEQQDFREVGVALGGNADAARMRVNRALEKLETILKRNGVTCSALALGTALAGEAAAAAPAGLAATVTGAALTSAAGGGATAAILKIITMTKLQASVMAAAVIAGVTVPLVVAHRAQENRREQEAFWQQRGDQWAAERFAFSNQLVEAKNARSLTWRELEELLRLRNENGSLRQKLAEIPKAPPAVVPAEPQTQIAADPEEEKRQAALQQLQYREKLNYAKTWSLAFRMYADDNQNQLPGSYDQAATYIRAAAKDNLLLATNEFEVVYHGSMSAVKDPSSTILFREITPPGATLRVYGFADGHAIVQKRDDGNFVDWEAQNTTTPASQ